MSATRGTTALPLLVLLLAQGATSLHIVFGAHNIPHPAKASTGGEDAFFFDDRLGIFGIADGVGGSAKNGQVDPGAFSREVLSRTYQCVNVAPRLPDALQMASAAPIDLGGSTTLVLGQLEGGTHLRLLNVGDSGAMLLRPGMREFGGQGGPTLAFPRMVVRTNDQEHGFNWPYQINLKNFNAVANNLDEISASVREGDIIIAATDGVFDNLFDTELQAKVSELLPFLCGEDPSAAQASIGHLAKEIAENAFAIGQKGGDPNVLTPFGYKSADDYMGRGKAFAGGKIDDVAIVCGVVREGTPPPLMVVNNFNGEADAKMWVEPTTPQPRPRPQPRYTGYADPEGPGGWSGSGSSNIR